MPKNDHALAIVSSSAASAPSALLPKLQLVAIQQVKLIRATETEAAQRGLLLGLTLWRIKPSMAGGFTKWLKQDFDALGYRQARYYMAAALCFIQETEVELPEFLALPGDQTSLSLESHEGKARKLMQKIEEFVDGRALGEMFDDLGIKESSTAKKKKALAKGEKPATAAEKEQSVQDRFNEIEAALRTAISAATDRATWMTFDRKQHDSLKAIFTDASDRLDAIHAKTHGRAARAAR